MAFEIVGVDKLARQLKELGEVAGGRALRSALFTASLPVLREIQAAAPVGTQEHRTKKGRLVAPGFLRRNIRRKAILSRDKTTATVLVGPSNEAFYAQFLEKGTSTITARPFIEPAFARSAQAATDRFIRELRALIKRASETS